MIRTLDPHVPNVVRYQTALHSVTSGASIDQRFSLHKRGNANSRKKVEVFVTDRRMLLISLVEWPKPDVGPQSICNDRGKRNKEQKSAALVAQMSPTTILHADAHRYVSCIAISQ